MIVSYGPNDAGARDSSRDLRELFAQNWIRANADIEKTILAIKERTELSGETDDGRSFDDILEELERLGLIRKEDGRFLSTARGRQSVRDAVFEKLFAGMERESPAAKALPLAEAFRERLPSTRKWQSGDDPRDIDWNSTLRNRVRREAGPRDLADSDIETWETETVRSTATVLMIDISHSMILYGTDRITPAKMVAIGLAEFLRRRRPRDTLDVIAFGNEAWKIPVESIDELQAGPFQTNTAEGLRLARQILHERRATDKRILLVTDGKPSCIFENGRLYRNTKGLDRRIVQRTLDEGILCLREGCRISTFMMADDPLLVEFVERFTRSVQGKAFFTGTDRLGEFVLRDWVDGRG